MTFKRLPALLLLMCLFVMTSRAGEPIMPPLPEPTPESQPVVTQPAPEPAGQTSAETTLPTAAVELLATAISSLLSLAL